MATQMSLKNTRIAWQRLLLIAVLVLGVVFRLVNLDGKVYWYDEGFTSLRIGGYTIPEVVQQSFNGQVISVADFRQKYLSPGSQRGYSGTIKSLAVEDPQHPPLYYLMTHLWMQWFGNSVKAIRSLPALISLLVLPCTYWLCLELFESPLVGWVAIALIAISPFHVIFAQEAREYSLWTVTILLSSATLLQAIRLKTPLSWGIYALSLAVALYSFLFSAFVAIGHGIYVIATERRWSKTVVAYLVASLVAFLAFLPWIWVVWNNLGRLHDSTAWMTNTRIPLSHLAHSWILNIKEIFFESSRLDRLLVPITLILVGYSIYFIYRHLTGRWLFIYTLFAPTALALIIPDIISGGQRSLAARFLIPCYLSIHLAVAYLIANKISSRYMVAWQQKFWQIVMIALIAGGIFSAATIAQSATPWTKLKNHNDNKLARTINQTESPLVVVSNYQSKYDSNASFLFGFSHMLDPKVQLQLVSDRTIPQIPSGFSDVFLYDPCASYGMEQQFKVLLSELDNRQHYKAQPVKTQPVLLWRLQH